MRTYLALIFLTVVCSQIQAKDPAEASRSPLADAMQRSDRTTVRSLLAEKQTDVNAPQADGMTALHWSVYHDDTELTKLIVDAGANLDSKNRYGVHSLSLACRNGNTAIVELLLKAGVDPNIELPGGETALMTAARTGKLGPVKALIAHDADVDAKERKGQNATMWAAAEGHVEVVDAMIHAGADYRQALKSGFTPFFFAVREGRSKVVTRLLKAGIDVNDVMQHRKSSGKGPRRRTSPLVLAVDNGHFELAAMLLDAGADPDEDRCGFSALHAITWVRKPVRGDGDPPPIGSGTLTSLELVRKLAGHGANVNARHKKHSAGRDRLNRTGATPFLLAAETGDVPLLNLLLELGADPTLVNEDQCTPLLAAAGVGVLSDGDESAGTEEDAIEAVRLILSTGADINAVDDRGNTAMHGAAFKSWTKLVQFLADNGANIEIWNRKNKRGWTPLKIARGQRPGNFRPSAETIDAIQRVIGAATPAAAE